MSCFLFDTTLFDTWLEGISYIGKKQTGSSNFAFINPYRVISMQNVTFQICPDSCLAFHPTWISRSYLKETAVKTPDKRD